MGLDIYLCSKKNGTHIEGVKDTVYPDHLFSPTYLRSSYNEGGINHILAEFCGTDLYGIFEYTDEKQVVVDPDPEYPDEEQTVFIPNWDEARKRTQAALDKLKAIDAPFRATFISAHPRADEDVTSTKESALKRFNDAYERNKGDKGPFRSFSNSYGTFDLDGWSVYAVMPGVDGENIFARGRPGAWIVYKMQNDVLQSYVESLEITLRFIDKGQHEDLAVIWSG